MINRKIFIISLSTFISLFGSEGWEHTQFIWNFGLISSCDVGCLEDPRMYFSSSPSLEQHQEIKKGDIVWVHPDLVSDFCEKILPSVQSPFILVISGDDPSFPSDCLKQKALEELISNKNIIHIFAQNSDYQGLSKKISPIPIGIDFHTIAYKGTSGGWGMTGSPLEQETLLLSYLQKALPTNQRKCRAFVDFHHSDTMHAGFKRYLQFGEDRASIFTNLLASNVIDYNEWVPRGKLWETKLNYAFSISPHGNGLDCHRTWEDLALGCIVIVKTSPLDILYEGLPVVIIQDWSEINEANLKKWLLEYGDAFTNLDYREKLTHKYWMTKIVDALNEIPQND